MDRKRNNPLRISVVDPAVQSPRITEEEGMNVWHWNSNNDSHGVARPQISHDDLSKIDSHRMLRNRRSLSPKLRGDIVLEKMMNPLLDRDRKSIDQSNAIEDNKKIQIESFHREKISVFDDAYHSVYVAPYPKGIRGFLVLFQSPILLVAIGTFSGCVGLFIDFWLAQIAEYHKILSDWGFWYFAFSALMAAGFSTTLTHVVCPQSAGSGLPFMKVAISGVDMSEFLSVRCVVTKIVGLVAAFAAGLSIGKEGPFIMISCGFGNILMNLPMFSRINNDESKRLEILACACAAGVAATFGSPFGGVLFGVEVTSHFYMVRNLPRSFFSAIIGALVVNFIAQNSRYGLFGNSNLGISEVNDLHTFSMTDLVVFVGIGILCGLGGALFNYCISVLVRLRDHYFSQANSGKSSASQVFWNGLGKRLLIVGCITFVTSFSEFYGDSAWFIRHGSPHRILASLFSRREKPFSDTDMAEDDSVLLSRSLVTYLPLKYLLTLLSVVLPIPAGLFTPTFMIGGIFGRLVGEAVIAFDIYQTQYEPFEFAIIGAGAFSSGVTHAISTAVIIMEVSHNDSLNIPVSVAILAAYFTAKRFTENVYDMLITTSHLPRLKKLPKAAYDIPAWEVMKDVKDMKFLTADSTYQEAKEVLAKSIEPVFPIVDSSENLFLLATVTRKRLEDAVLYCHHKINETQNQNENKDAQPLDTDGLYVNDDLKLDLNTWPIHFVFRRGGKIMEWGTNDICPRTKLSVLVNPSPFQIMEMTPMKRVDLLFRMLKLNNAYVTRTGRLVGVISRDRLMTFLGKSSKYKVPGLISTVSSCCCGQILNAISTKSGRKHEYQPIP